MSDLIVIEFQCEDCDHIVTTGWGSRRDYMTRVCTCPNCDELYAVILDDDDLSVHTLGPEIEVDEVSNLRGNPSEDVLTIFPNPNPDKCEFCGLKYDDMRTGEDYNSIITNYLWSGSDDPEDWPYKNRKSVLGKWHQIKLSDWADHVAQCQEHAEQQEAEAEEAFEGEDDDEIPF